MAFWSRPKPEPEPPAHAGYFALHEAFELGGDEAAVVYAGTGR